jgi:hypothetical protein
MICILTLCISIPISAAVFDIEDRSTDLRSLAMGSAGIALSDAPDAFHHNPAALFRTGDTQFLITGRYGELLASDNSPISWIQRPVASFEMIFSNPFVGLSIGLSNILEAQQEVHPDDREEYLARNLSRIKLTASYGWETVSFGFFAEGGTATQRDVSISTSSALFDYLSQTYLDRYTSVGDSGQLFASGFGMLLSYPWISIALLTNSLFTLDGQTNQLILDITQVFDTTALGMAVTTPAYSRTNELNRVVVIGAFDVTDLGSDDNRAVRIGFEGKLQFLSDFWIALRGGYREIRPLGQSLFSFSGNGMITAGIGSQIGSFTIDTALSIPLGDQPMRFTGGLRWKL